MFILGSNFFHPGSTSKYLNILSFNYKKNSEILSGLFIPDPDLDFLPIPDPGVQNVPYPGSGSATLPSFFHKLVATIFFRCCVHPDLVA
jgi:hypothetical protein